MAEKKAAILRNHYTLSIFPLLYCAPDPSSATVPNITIPGSKLLLWLVDRFQVDRENAEQLAKELEERGVIRSNTRNTLTRSRNNTVSGEKVERKIKKSFSGPNEEDFQFNGEYHVTFPSKPDKLEIHQEVETNFGRNFVAIDKDAKELILLKFIPKNDPKELYNLYSILLDMSKIGIHPNLLHPKRVLQDEKNIIVHITTLKTNFKLSGQSQQETVDLFNFLVTKKTYLESHATSIITQLVQAVKVLHDHSIVSNNINISNIYVTKEQRRLYKPPPYAKAKSCLISQDNIQDIKQFRSSLTRDDRRNNKIKQSITSHRSFDQPSQTSIPLNESNGENLRFGMEKYNVCLLLIEHIRCADNLFHIQKNIFTAPEVLEAMNNDELKTVKPESDIWSIGMCFHLIIQNYRLPLIASTLSNYLKLFPHYTPQIRLPGRPKISKSIRLIISKHLLTPPDTRPTSNDLLSMLQSIGETSVLDLTLFNSNYLSLYYTSFKLSEPSTEKTLLNFTTPTPSSKQDKADKQDLNNNNNNNNNAGLKKAAKKVYQFAVSSHTLAACSSFYNYLLKQTKQSIRKGTDSVELSSCVLKFFPFCVSEIDHCYAFLENINLFSFVIDCRSISFKTTGNFGLEDVLKQFKRLFNHKHFRLAKQIASIEKDGSLSTSPLNTPIVITVLNIDLFGTFIQENIKDDHVMEVFQDSFEVYYLKRYLKQIFFQAMGHEEDSYILRLFCVDDDANNMFDSVIFSIESALHPIDPTPPPSNAPKKIKTKIKEKIKEKILKFTTEGIIKQIQSKPTSLSLSHQAITVKHLEEILPSLTVNRSIKHINMSGNNTLGDTGISLLMHCLIQRKGLISINLSDCSITADTGRLIGQFITANPKLHSIDLSNNPFTDLGILPIAEEMQMNTSLATVNLANCLFTSAGGLAIIHSLRYHPKLEALNLNGNRIPYSILDLITLFIKRNPISKLRSLFTLDIFNEYLDYRVLIRKRLKKPMQKSKVELHSTLTLEKIISSYPPNDAPIEINLSHLTINSLILTTDPIPDDKEKSKKELEKEATEIYLFSRCELLNLEFNLLSSLPSFCAFRSLKILNLSSNRITSLSTSLVSLAKVLEELYLYNNTIEDGHELENSLRGFNRLRVLDVRSNNLITSPNVDDFESLTDLLLDNNNLAQPPNVKSYSGTILHRKINRISLSNNPTLQWPVVHMYHTFSCDIQVLNLSRCGIKDLSRHIGLCVCLIDLNLSDNAIANLPPQIGGLYALKSLNLSNNKLKSFHSLYPLTSLSLIQCLIDGNPLPPSLLNAPSFSKLVEIIEGNIPKNTLLNHVKVSLVGPPSSGKSATAKLLPFSLNPKLLKKKMQQQLGEEKTTDYVSIKISKWKAKIDPEGSPLPPNVHHNDSIRFSIWDYRGAEVYYQPHSLFLKERSVFLVFINISIPESKQRGSMIQWLDMLANSFPNSPVVIVATHTDVLIEKFTKSAEFPNAQSRIDHLSNQIVEHYGKLYKNITNFVAVSNINDAGSIEILGNTILDIAKSQSYLKKIYSYRYISLEKSLKAEKRLGNPVVRIDFFEQMVLSCGVEGAVQTITELATLLGLVYHSNGLATVCIDLDWLLHITSSFINDQKDPLISKGYLYHSNLTKLLNFLPVAFVTPLIQIFNFLEILYTSPLVDEVKGPYSIIPSLLPDQRPPHLESKWISVDEYIQLNEGIQLERLYQFNSTPQFGFFLRLMVRLMHFTTPNVLWKSGILCERGDSHCLVEFELGREISVKVRGKDPSKLLRLIVENIDLLLSGWYQNQPKILVPFTYQMEYQKSTEKQSIFSLEELEVAASQGKLEISMNVNAIKIESIAPDLVLADMADILIDFKNDLKIIKIIGEGGFGKVYTAEYKGQIVAVKQVIVEEHLKVEVYREFRREVALCWSFFPLLNYY